MFAVGYTEISYAKRVIIFTGLTMLLVNFSSSWILESKFMKNNLLKFRIPVSQEITENPDERIILFLGKEEPKELLKTYEIKKVYDYQKVTHDMERIYLLEKIY